MTQLQKALAGVGAEVQALSRQRLDSWVRNLADTIQSAVNALGNLFDAFSASTLGQGLGAFARGLGGLASLIPGLGSAVGGLISAVGDALGRVIDGVLSMFDSGWGKVQAKLRDAADKLLLVDPALLQRAVETYTESYLFGLISVTKHRVNEEVLQGARGGREDRRERRGRGA